MLGLYAIAELWGYKKFPKKLKQRIDKTVDVLNLGLTDIKTYRKRKDPTKKTEFYKKSSTSNISRTPDGYITRLVN